MSYYYTLGTDPEYFVMDPAGKAVPAHTVGIPGKDAKIRFTDNKLAFRDGYAVEINAGPSTCRETLTNQVLDTLWRVRKLLPAGHTLKSVAAVPIDLAAMKDAPADVLTFGCDPSWNAYTMESSVPELDAMSHPFRYAGGHLHLSRKLKHSNNGCHCEVCNQSRLPVSVLTLDKAADIGLYVRMLDLYLGVPLTYWFDSPETFARRQYYGRAGEFRYQEYGRDDQGDPLYIGVEYRTPGPEVWNAPPVASFALGIMRDLALNFTAFAKRWDSSIEPAVRDAVNTGRDLATLIRYFPYYVGTAESFRALVANKPFSTLHAYDTERRHYGRRGWETFMKYGADKILRAGRIEQFEE